MFEDSLMESGGRIKTHQKWTGLISTLAQLALLGFLVLLPLIFTEALPKGLTTNWLVAPPPPPPPPPPAAPQIQHVQKVSEIVDGALRTPNKIPKKIQMIKEEESPQAAGVTRWSCGWCAGWIGEWSDWRHYWIGRATTKSSHAAEAAHLIWSRGR